MISLKRLFATSVAVVAGCGGSSSNTSTSVDGSASDATSSDANVASLDEGIPGYDDGSPGASGSSGSSGASTSSSGASSGGSSSGAASSGGSASSGASSSSSGGRSDGGRDQIACGATTCDSLTQVCCASRTGRVCTAPATCKGDSLACSGSNSCMTGVCCEELTTSGAIESVCAASCPAGSRQLCTTKAECGAGRDCRAGADGYGVCVAAPRDAGVD